MADALCGPSNAVQNLAKHSSVDRTLQQDRLVSRQPPAQGFRSYNPPAASLDPEFEAFQAGHAHAPGPGPAFAGPSFAAPSFSNNNFHPPPQQTASPVPSAAWTQDFQRLNISTPSQSQSQHPPQAWHAHFDRNVHSPASFQSPSAQMQPLSARFQFPPAFHPMQTAIHTPPYLQQSQQPQAHHHLPQDQFDEAAFEAAFDAAMQDASTDKDTAMQDQHAHSDVLDNFDFDSFLTKEPAQESFKVDVYPHLPLFRIVLANALVTNTDESLHKAARVVNALIQHPQNIDPVQAMLLRSLLSALNDPKRTLFARRYGFEPALNQLLERLADQTDQTRLEIGSTTEQLLASYADLLWQRNESNHLQPRNPPSQSDNAYWIDQFYSDDTFDDAENITVQSARLLSEGFQRQLISDTSYQALNRVLDLEYDIYAARPIAARSQSKLKHPISSQEREGRLFSMMERSLAEPETVEAIETMIRQLGAEESPVQTLQDYQQQLIALEEQNKQRLFNAHQRGMERTEGLHIPNAEQESRLNEPMYEEEEEQEAQQKQESDRQHDDELAQTAANLLDRVSDNQTSKFKNSAFLGLMRQLADREVRVEGDKMVPTNGSVRTADTGQTAQIQDGQEVVDLLKQPDSITDQDPEFMMTSPFASADDY